MIDVILKAMLMGVVMVVAAIWVVPFCPKYGEVRVAKTSGIFKYLVRELTSPPVLQKQPSHILTLSSRCAESGLEICIMPMR